MGTRRDNDINQYGTVEQSDGSYIDNRGNIVWYNEEGQYHREDGPAVIYASGRGSYWRLNNREYSFDEWCIKLNKSDEAKMLLRLQYG
jgi:hypothetical protein